MGRERETEEEREREGEISGKSNKEREVNRMMGRSEELGEQQRAINGQSRGENEKVKKQKKGRSIPHKSNCFFSSH